MMKFDGNKCPICLKDFIEGGIKTVYSEHSPKLEVYRNIKIHIGCVDYNYRVLLPIPLCELKKF